MGMRAGAGSISWASEPGLLREAPRPWNVLWERSLLQPSLAPKVYQVPHAPEMSFGYLFPVLLSSA